MTRPETVDSNEAWIGLWIPQSPFVLALELDAFAELRGGQTPQALGAGLIVIGDIQF